MIVHAALPLDEYAPSLSMVSAAEPARRGARADMPKAAFQFRDLRATAGTDKTDSAGDIRKAQQQLGHQPVTTTEIYVRKRRGALTSPTK